MDVQLKLVLYYLSLYQPAWDGCFAVIAWFELQGYWTRADVGDGNVGRRSRHLYGNGRGETCKMNGRNGSVGKIKDLGIILSPFTHNTSCWLIKKGVSHTILNNIQKTFTFYPHAYLPYILRGKKCIQNQRETHIVLICMTHISVRHQLIFACRSRSLQISITGNKKWDKIGLI